jgi:hypothetical protein
MKQSPIQMVLEGVAAIFVVSTANARDLNYATSQSGGLAKQHGAVAPIPQYGAVLAPIASTRSPKRRTISMCAIELNELNQLICKLEFAKAHPL